MGSSLESRMFLPQPNDRVHQAAAIRLSSQQTPAAALVQRAVRQVEPTAISSNSQEPEPKFTPSFIAVRSLFRHLSKRNHFFGRFVFKACGLGARIFIGASFPSLVLLIGTPQFDIAIGRRSAGPVRLPSFITRALSCALISLSVPVSLA